MESEPEQNKDPKSNIGNLLKANLVFLSYHLAVNIRGAFLNQYLYHRYVHQLEDNTTYVVPSNFSNKCFANESDPAYKLHIKAEEMSNDLQVIFNYVSTPLCLISSVFLGSYSDFIGRKILFVIPLLGEATRNALCTAIIYWDLDLQYMYIGEAVVGLTSGYNGVMLASYVYSADSTPSHSSRTIGLAVVDFTTNFAAALSQVGTGYFIKYTGYVLPSLTTAGLTLLATLFVIVILPETVPSHKKAEPSIFTAGLATPYASVVRSLMSKMAPPEIQGSIFAGQTVVTLIAFITGQSLFGFIYDSTLSINRGIVYFSTGGAHAIAAAILVLFVLKAPGVLRQSGTEEIFRTDTTLQEATNFAYLEEKNEDEIQD